jgi:very-short-patch-repair endonuclease
MPRKILPYNPYLKPLAKKLRSTMTVPELLLWQHLKGRKMLDMDFDRQRPIFNYIVDFYCKDVMLAIEVDGSSHDNTQEQDAIRQQELEQMGVRFLRITNDEVIKDINNVLRTIALWLTNTIETEGRIGLVCNKVEVQVNA